MRDLVQLRALCVAADGEAFVPVSLEETSDQRTPAFILQMNTIIEDSVQLAVAKGVVDVNNLRAGITSDRIGRYIRFCGKDGVGAWIGMDFELWRQHGGTPIWLTFWSRDFGRAVQVRRILEPWATRKGLSSCSENDRFAIGLDLLAGEGKDVVVRSIVDDIESIATELSELPPSQSSAEGRDE